MNDIRKQEILDQILAYMAGQNCGPGQYVPVKTVWSNLKFPNGDEFSEVLAWAEDDLKFLTARLGGPSNMGSIALTDSGYEESRKDD